MIRLALLEERVTFASQHFHGQLAFELVVSRGDGRMRGKDAFLAHERARSERREVAGGDRLLEQSRVRSADALRSNGTFESRHRPSASSTARPPSPARSPARAGNGYRAVQEVGQGAVQGSFSGRSYRATHRHTEPPTPTTWKSHAPRARPASTVTVALARSVRAASPGPRGRVLALLPSAQCCSKCPSVEQRDRDERATEVGGGAQRVAGEHAGRR